jgi:enoyl-CoA hydratase/carnithine racemase
VAVRLSRDVVLRAALAADAEAWRISSEAYKAVVDTEDFREGPRAFVEKRPPNWVGR